MKVLFVSSGNTSGGISPIVKRQGESLKQSGIPLDFFTIKGKGIAGYLSNISKLKHFLRSNNYDIIHAHYGLCGIISYFAKSNEKLIISYMGDDLVGSPNHNGTYTTVSKLLVRVNKYFARKKYDFVIVKSDRLASILCEIRNVAVIPNGVNFNVFRPVDRRIAEQKLQLSSNKKRVLFAADPSRPEKNVTLAEKACKLFDNEELELKIVYGLPEDRLNLYYNSSDVLLLTSFHEGSPNVVKEAMAANCPVVSTDVGDVRHVTNGALGCYLTTYDPVDVSNKINLTLQYNQRTNGRENIQHLREDKIAKKIISIYETLLGN